MNLKNTNLPSWIKKREFACEIVEHSGVSEYYKIIHKIKLKTRLCPQTKLGRNM